MAKKLKVDTGEEKFGPYSPGINVDDYVWLSGQVDIDAGNDIESQTIGTLSKTVSYTHLTLPTKA